MTQALTEGPSHRQSIALVGVLASVCGACWWAACRSPGGSHTPPPPAALRVGISIGQMAAADPQTGVRSVAQNQSVEALVRIGDDGRPSPWLAQSWDFGPDGRSLTVHLRPNVTFHDGSPVTAATVAGLLQGDLSDFMGDAFEDIEQITAPAAHDLNFALRHHSAFLLEALDIPLRRPGPTLVGTGPFEPAGSTAPNELRANSHYYLGRPIVDRIVVSMYPTVRAAWAEMLRDHLDMLYDVGTDALDSFERSNKISVFTFLRPFQYVLIFNTKRDAFRPPQVRQALSQAIDRATVVRDALAGHGVPSSGPIWPHHWALGPTPETFAYDPVKAAKALGPHGLRFTCLVPPDYERLALTLKRQLEAINVTMEVSEVPSDRLLAAMQRGEFDAVLLDVISGPSLFRLYRWWHSGTANPAGFSSPAVDAALDHIRHSASDDDYRAGVASFQHAMIADPPAVFLAWSERARAVSKRFVVPHAEPGRDILSTLRFWSPVADESQANRN